MAQCVLCGCENENGCTGFTCREAEGLPGYEYHPSIEAPSIREEVLVSVIEEPVDSVDVVDE